MWRKFPTKWYEHLKGTPSNMSLDKIPSMDQPENSERAANREESLMMLVVFAYYWILGPNVVQKDFVVSTSQVLKAYYGELPQTNDKAWLKKNEDLYSYIIDAFRTSVKLVVDCSALGEVSSFNDLSVPITHHGFLEESYQHYL